jgi:uncharacterized YigZ family protein
VEPPGEHRFLLIQKRSKLGTHLNFLSAVCLQTVTKIFTSDYRIKGSKFLGYLCPAGSRQEAEAALEKIREEHPTATHHCYAFRINPSEPEEFDQDDGEPRGTAGMPILNALRSAELINTVCVSVRYYGGTKLGKSGLIDAYGESARLCVEKADLKTVIPVIRYRFVYDYTHQGIIDKLKNDFPLVEFNSVYLEKVELDLGCPRELHKRFKGALKPSLHLLEEAEETGPDFHIRS